MDLNQSIWDQSSYNDSSALFSHHSQNYQLGFPQALYLQQSNKDEEPDSLKEESHESTINKSPLKDYCFNQEESLSNMKENCSNQVYFETTSNNQRQNTLQKKSFKDSQIVSKTKIKTSTKNPWKNEGKKYVTAIGKSLSSFDKKKLLQLKAKLSKLRKRNLKEKHLGSSKHSKSADDIQGSSYYFTCKLIQISLLLGHDSLMACYQKYQKVVNIVARSSKEEVDELHRMYVVEYEKSFRALIDGDIERSVSLVYEVGFAKFKQKKYKRQAVEFVNSYYQDVKVLKLKECSTNLT